MTDTPGGRDQGEAPFVDPVLDEEPPRADDEVAHQFLAAMRGLAATVCVLAASTPDGECYGMTATAVCSLSIEPPQIVACINRSSSLAKALSMTSSFSVNILAGDQEEVAVIFAGRTGKRGSERFDDEHWSPHATGTPVLDGAVATLVCHLSNSIDQDTHQIVIGEGVDVLMPDGGPPAPLMYHMRRFTTVNAALADEPPQA